MKDSVREGDILVFKPGDHWLSKAIALLTDSDVSHAAIVYRGGTVVEMELPGIQITPFTVQEGDTAYLMRLDSEPDAWPLMKAADVYLDEKSRYDIPGLVLLAGLLIYRSVRPTPAFVEITDLILRAAVRAMDQLIQTVILQNPHEALVCSQLVYQIYNDCGKDYQIHLKDGTFQSFEGSMRLIEQIERSRTADESLQETAISYYHGGEDSPELLARRLCEVLTAGWESNEGAEDDGMPIRSLVGPGKKLLEQLEELLKLCKQDIPIDALFVTPADLVYHTENLRLIKTLNILKG